jgi:hypothetical protein
MAGAARATVRAAIITKGSVAERRVRLINKSNPSYRESLISDMSDGIGIILRGAFGQE